MSRILKTLAGTAVFTLGSFALVNAATTSPTLTGADTTTACVRPSGSATRQQILDYTDCRANELAARMQQGSTTTSPTPTPTTSTSPTPTQTPTTSTSPTPTQTPTTSTSPTPTQTPTTTAPSTSAWPGPDNTGVPAGTTLTAYSGPCTITSSVTITAVDATGKCDAILIKAPNVVINKSKLPRVDATAGGSYSVSLTDDTVLGGTWSDGAIWGYNITATRVNVTGGQHTFHCADNCTVVDSWLHDQYNPSGQGYHNNAFISNGGSNMVIRHNTLHCTAILNSTDGGCTADLSLFGDFEPISHVVIDNNLFKANNSSISYCLYAGWNPGKPYGDNPTYVQVTNNVWERGANNKCGVYGPVTSYKDTGTGNTWSNNTWIDGAVVNPAA